MIPALLFVALYLVSRETSWGARGASPANREGIGTAAFASLAARATKLLSRETPVRELARRLYFFRETTQVKFLEAFSQMLTSRSPVPETSSKNSRTEHFPMHCRWSDIRSEVTKFIPKIWCFQSDSVRCAFFQQKLIQFVGNLKDETDIEGLSTVKGKFDRSNILLVPHICDRSEMKRSLVVKLMLKVGDSPAD